MYTLVDPKEFWRLVNKLERYAIQGLIFLTCVKVITVTFSILNRNSHHAKEQSKMMIFSTSFPPQNNPSSWPEAERTLQKIKRADNYRYPFPFTITLSASFIIRAFSAPWKFCSSDEFLWDIKLHLRRNTRKILLKNFFQWHAEQKLANEKTGYWPMCQDNTSRGTHLLYKMQHLLGCLTIHNVSKLYFESPNYIIIIVWFHTSNRMVQLFQSVEKTCISINCFQAAFEIAYYELSFAHNISSQTIKWQFIKLLPNMLERITFA